MNYYAYCYGNPITYTDPSGHIPVLVVVAVKVGARIIFKHVVKKAAKKYVKKAVKKTVKKYAKKAVKKAAKKIYKKAKKSKITKKKNNKVTKKSRNGNVKPKISAKKKRTKQVHHFATNKNKKYTPKFKEITDKYGLDLDGEWNKATMKHQGRHPNEYHEYVLNNIRKIDAKAKGNQKKFLRSYKRLKLKIRMHSKMLRKEYWKNK